ncbi:hypothetical protein BZG36_03022 [Bifiguratus adelaidae]|uniref:Uncharacterized protein n=1 Tax=Bifiguratus adelaidae TaxID=1938954 RepID=A0A261XZK3_9FUNG|nr:hypothetical protein BZG36_03022 [Bifiguratus adelaidae]
MLRLAVTWLTKGGDMVEKIHEDYHSSETGHLLGRVPPTYNSFREYNDEFRNIMLLPGDTVSPQDRFYEYIYGLKPQMRVKVEESDPLDLEVAMRTAAIFD